MDDDSKISLEDLGAPATPVRIHVFDSGKLVVTKRKKDVKAIKKTKHPLEECYPKM